MALSRFFLDQRLQALRENLVRLSSLFEAALRDALGALAGQDIRTALTVIANDQNINALRYQIEADCLAVIATQQPTAQDLRAIMAIFTMTVDLERMADYAAGIATLVVRLGEESPLKLPLDLQHMAEACSQMTSGALEAYLRANPEQARAIIEQDAAVDRLYAQVFRELLTCMLETPDHIVRALSLMFVAHNLERIGDRAANLAARAEFALARELPGTAARPSH